MVAPSTAATALVERLLAEDRLSASQAAALFPPLRGRRTHGTTVVRWITRGKSGVRLEGFRGAGKSWWTSRQAVTRFLAALTEREVAVACEPTAEEMDRHAREAVERVRAKLKVTRGKPAG